MEGGPHAGAAVPSAAAAVPGATHTTLRGQRCPLPTHPPRTHIHPYAPAHRCNRVAGRVGRHPTRAARGVPHPHRCPEPPHDMLTEISVWREERAHQFQCLEPTALLPIGCGAKTYTHRHTCKSRAVQSSGKAVCPGTSHCLCPEPCVAGTWNVHVDCPRAAYRNLCRQHGATAPVGSLSSPIILIYLS